MSRTKRKDFYVESGQGTWRKVKPWKDTADKKKSYKPGKKAKVYLHKGRKAKLKQEVKKCNDFDNLPNPKEPHSDMWYYN